MCKLVAIFMFACMLGCASTGLSGDALVMRDAQVSVHATADTIEMLQSIALVLYRVEQITQVQIAQSNGETRAQATARVASVRASWVPVWNAFTDARAVYAVTASLLATQPQPTAAAIQSAIDKQQASLATLQSLLNLARDRNTQGSAP